MRAKPYWKDPVQLAQASKRINTPLKLLVLYAERGDTMQTINPHGHKHVRYAMDDVFLADLPHQAALNPVLAAIF